MKKLRFSILQQVILTILLIAVFPIFEGFCLYSTFHSIEKKSNAQVAQRILQTFLKNPYTDKRRKKEKQECEFHAKWYVSNLSYCSTLDEKCVEYESFDDYLCYFFIKTCNRLKDDVRIRLVKSDYTLIADNINILDDYYWEQDKNYKSGIITPVEYEKITSNYIVSDRFYSGHDFYDSYLYNKFIIDGSEIKAAEQRGIGYIERHSLEYDNISTLYVAKPFYIDSEFYGFVLISKTFYEITTNKAEWGFLLGNFCFLSLLLSIPFIIFLILRLSLPVKKLSKTTLKYSIQKGRIDASQIPYQNINNEIGDLSYSFSTLIAKLNDSIDYLEVFSSDVTHELKNPITAILMNAEILNEYNLSKKETKKIYTELLRDSKKLSFLLSEIRDCAKLENSLETDSYTETVDFDSLIENIVSAVQISYPETPFIVEKDENSHCLQISPINAERLLINVIDNAASFGNKVMITTLNIDNKQLKVIIEDSGPGIPIEERNKVFNRFYSNRRNANNKDHSGLGLSNVRAIINAYNGSIEIDDSEKLGGAKFTINFNIS